MSAHKAPDPTSPGAGDAGDRESEAVDDEKRINTIIKHLQEQIRELEVLVKKRNALSRSPESTCGDAPPAKSAAPSGGEEHSSTLGDMDATKENEQISAHVDLAAQPKERAYPRSPAGLSAMPSRLFDSGSVGEGGEDSWETDDPAVVAHQQFLRSLFPRATENRLLVGFSGCSMTSHGASAINKTSVQWIRHIVIKMLKSPLIKDSSILILTFYRAQACAIDARINTLASIGFIADNERKRVGVRTVDDAQGHQADIVIWDTAHPTYCTGIISDKRRLNLAMTRSKYLEIGIINGATMFGEARLKDNWLRRVHDDMISSNPRSVVVIPTCKMCKSHQHKEKDCREEERYR